MSDPQTQDLKQTPLDSLHRRRGARMVPFAGYDMPVQYETGIIAEHTQTRNKASLFDVSHMGQARLIGANAAASLETLVPGELQALKPGRTRYTVLTSERGGILDDLMVSKADDHLFLVVNAANKDADFAHIGGRLSGLAELEVLTDRALLALQGPAAAQVLARCCPGVDDMAFMSTATLDIAGISCIATRSGYTGEDGFEISVASGDAETLAERLLAEPEVAPAGLGARDSLRLEAGLCLHGNDIDDTTTPVEAGLSWIIGKRRRDEGGFPGSGVILAQLRDGPARKRVGIKPDGKAPARAHTAIRDRDGNPLGEVTSGGYGPSIGGPVAMGYVEAGAAEPGTAINLTVRGKALPGQVVGLPFVPHRYFKG